MSLSMEGPAQQAKAVVWIPTKAVKFATPKRLSSITVAVLGTALLILASFFIYVYHRRKLKIPGARFRRGKVASAPQQPVGVELIGDDVDDEPRSGRSGPRKLPWLLSWLVTWHRPQATTDVPRSFPFPIELERLWTGDNPSSGPVVDELVDPGYDDSRPDATGPRIMATTASGKSLQVVVKTAAVTSRQPSGQRQQHTAEPDWAGRQRQAGAPDPSSSGLPGATNSQHLPATPSRLAEATSASLVLTPAPSHGSTPSDAVDGPTSPYSPSRRAPGGGGGGGRGPALRIASKSTSALAAASATISSPRPSLVPVPDPGLCPGLGPGGGATLASSDNDVDDDDEEELYAFDGVSAGGGMPYYDGHGDAVKVLLGSLNGALASGIGRVGAGTALGNGGAGLRDPLLAGGPGLDPAAAWYSRALHRKVSAVAAGAQAMSGSPKVHVA